ncbi:MAG: DUF4129 domain-containing protein [Gemmatimonadota bacterium]|nr:DUF4129 domain-containing protein [Gemmatimonadota bacterium]
MTTGAFVLWQAAPRTWPSGAVHDTVEAVGRSAAFRRSLRESLGDRLLMWIYEWLHSLLQQIRGTGLARTAAIGLAAVLIGLVVARLILSVRARDESVRVAHRGRVTTGEDPWLQAERLAAEGRYGEAAHALYHGVLASLAHAERLRLDPSKTSGDYARELRARRSAAHAPFRDFSRRFDAAVFGRDVCDAILIDDLRRLALPLAPRGGARAA